ncbi:Transcriptional regulator, TetR family [Alteracholeplasma palmae J233]|uniref:Transcriptional regulator, TetR family n=1 Tax=Alteracholeplasma palmae (strain ATCC 49389 / J233) TaxID=1318466 RepID=U4KKT0_ALTPJ|nr:TetR/AcrR family transcriptional regulator [Alteracholeplasma palmae]CCV64263.1 Transcriptional regulator, TetR family [Alteracholeplasma palmae J233]
MGKHIERTLKKRNDILEATKLLLKEKSIHHITIDDIKKRAHVSQVTIYNIFGSKDILITEVLKLHANEAICSVVKILESDCSAYDKLMNYFKFTFNTFTENPYQESIQEYVYSGLNKEIKDYVLNLYQGSYPAMIKLYTSCLEAKLIRPSITMELFFQMCDMYTQIKPKFYASKEQLDNLLESIIKSFA